MTTTPRPIDPAPKRTDVPIESAHTHGSADQPAATVGLPAAAKNGEANPTPLERIGDFTILGKLGEGGMGTVYRAEDPRLKRMAAIKTMKRELAAKPENRERFLREAQAAAAVEHDNIVPIWQIGEAADGSLFIIMPLLQGEMLDDRLKREPVPSLGVLLKVAREVADGLAAAHAKGLIHRDIKPSNVWIESDPTAKDLAHQFRRCKILDFGLTRTVGADDVHLTASGTILGTPTYMAPEQARGEEVDHRADLFSLGVMLYRMATGRLPFEGKNMTAVLTALATVTPPPVRTLNPNLPPALSDLIDRLLCKDPAGRPQSSAEVAATIRRIARELQPKPLVALPVAAPPANTWEDMTAADHEPAPKAPSAEKAKRNRLPLLIALGFLALVPLLWWLATIVRMETDKGTLVVEIGDPETEARIKGGKLILTGGEGKKSYTLTPSERNKKLEAGPYKIRVEGADGLVVDTPKFEMKKGGKVTVRVTMVPPAVVKEPDRRAAEYVLSIGGMVRINDFDYDIKTIARLPEEAFRLMRVDLKDNKKVRDAGLACFDGCKKLTHLSLESTKVGDEGLVHFKDCKNLSELDLRVTQVSDAGLAHLKDCNNLTMLLLTGPKVSDTGLAHFKGCKNLTKLGLHYTQVTDAGLAHLKDCKKLSDVWLHGSPVGDQGLAHFKDYPNLTHLNLYGTKVSHAGLAHLKDCKNLKALTLDDSQITDTGLTHLKDCKNLISLDLKDTKFTAVKIAELRKALPKCKIVWEGAIEPK